MPNQNNYVEPIGSLQNKRPYRLSSSDRSRTFVEDKNVLFGTTLRDNVEIWIYNPNGTLVSNVVLPVDDPAISLAATVDVVGADEYLKINFDEVIARLNLPQGRYTATWNFFRNEVGSLDGYRLGVDEISSDRTEIRCSPIAVTGEIINDIYEFVTPSVPRLYAQGLIDQLFEKNLDVVEGEQFSPESLLSRMNTYISTTSTKLEAVGAYREYGLMVQEVMEKAYDLAIQKVVADTDNYAVQQIEIEKYLDESINEAMDILEAQKKIDARFQLT